MKTITANVLGFTIEIEIDPQELKSYLVGLLKK